METWDVAGHWATPEHKAAGKSGNHQFLLCPANHTIQEQLKRYEAVMALPGLFTVEPAK